MGSSKTHQYSVRQNKFARIAKAIGHPARVAIIQNLASYGGLTNLQIMEITTLSGGTISQHLKELVKAGILTEVYIDKHFYILTEEAEKAISDLQLIFHQNPD